MNVLLGFLLLFPALVSGASQEEIRVYSVEEGGYVMTQKVTRSEEEWKRLLSPEAYHVARQRGTERAFSGMFWNHHEEGTYRCIGCSLDLFSSQDKYESGTGWPSFTRPVASENVATEPDDSFFMRRTEVHCPRCGSHLGHVFDDGPPPSGKRYCINSAALTFFANKERP